MNYHPRQAFSQKKNPTTVCNAWKLYFQKKGFNNRGNPNKMKEILE